MPGKKSKRNIKLNPKTSFSTAAVRILEPPDQHTEQPHHVHQHSTSMETSSHLDSLKEMVSCSVCYAVLDEPYTLPCFHNLCLEHKQELPIFAGKGGDGIRCPICNSFSKTYEKGNQVLMKQLVDVYTKVSEGKYECTQCKSMTGRWRCIDCKVDLCDTCQQGHQNITVCKGHRTVRHEDCEPGTLPKIDTFVYCEKHPTKEIEFNCTDCEISMCYKCYVLNHNQHHCESLETATERIRPQVATDITKLKDRTTAYRTEVKKFKSQADVIGQTADDVKAAILRERDELMAKIEAETEAKIKKLDSDTIERLKHVNMNRESLENSSANIESLTNWSKNVLNNTAGASLLVELQRNLIPCLKKMCDSPVNIPKLDTAVTKFTPTRLVDTQQHLLGTVDTTSK